MAALCRPIRIHRGTATRAANGRATRLVVETNGFRDGMWLDAAGNPMTDAAKITERFRRPDFGHMEIEITVDDPKAYTKPWTVKLNQIIELDTDLLDFVCADNEKDVPHLSPR